MAPISRTTRSGAGIGKKVQRKHLVHKEPSNSWSLLHSQGMNPKAVDIVMGHDDDDDDRTPSPPLNGPADVEQAVEPLREVAERVGTQVEDFAVELDKFFQDLPTASNRFDAVHELVDQFKSIADKTIDNLKKRYDRDLREYQKQEWNEQGRVSAGSSTAQGPASAMSKSTSPRISEQLKELQQWQQESDLWDLFRTSTLR